MTHPFDGPNAEWDDIESPPAWEQYDEYDTLLLADESMADEPLGDEAEFEASRPSLPIILFSAACGIAGGILVLFICFRWLDLPVEMSAGFATLGLLFSLGISGALMTSATGSRSTPVNILFSCGLILLAIFFLALCLLVGALISTLVI